MNDFWSGFEKRAKDIVYHGSPKKLRIIRPQNLHGDPDVKNVVFATPHLPMAAAYAGGKWGDRDINQSSHVRKSTGERIYTLEEMRPGAFDELFRGKGGYLYKLPAKKFVSADTFGRVNASEVVSSSPVKPLETVKIKDAYQHLKDNGVVLKSYNPKSSTYRSAVNRMRARSKHHGKDYIDWIRETNPELADNIEKKASYDPPMRDLPKELKNCPIHSWRARTGIEMVHPEPSRKELDRIWENWKQMPRREKIRSDYKSRKLFGMTNEEHYRKLTYEGRK